MLPTMSEPTSLGRVRTCENCVRAKIRCSRTSTQSCDRCLRLKKDCYFRATKARTPKKRETRLGALEDKVDQILSQINQPHSSPQQAPLPLPLSPKSESCAPTPRNPCDVIGNGLITHEEANRLIESFRDAITYFPFVQLPRNATVEDLRSEKPFLLLSILLVSSFRNVPLHLALEDVSTSYLGGQVLQGNRQQPFDILQGLLVTIAGAKKKLHLVRFSGYLHLAQSIINDCRLDYPAKLRGVRQRIDVMSETDPPTESISLRNEEMRALVGYFLLDACHSIVLQRTGTMPWSPFIESCAAKLSQECEFSTDRYLLGQVQVQHMLVRIDSLVARGFARLPVPIDHDVFQGIPSHAFDIHLYQTIFFDVYPSSAASFDHSMALLRIDALCHGLAAAKQFMSFYFSLPPGIEKRFSYTQWTMTGFSVAASCKLVLASLEPSVRDHDQVRGLRETLDMRHEIQKSVKRLNTLDQECKGGKWDQHEMFFYQDWLRFLSEWFEEKYRLAQSDSAGENNGALGVFTPGISENNIYEEPQPDPGFPWVDLQDVTIEEMLNVWLEPINMPHYV
ncbi:hypothetical protein RU639_008907 [Aspergillus parasiticus]